MCWGKAQLLELGITKSCTQLFNNHIYAFGLLSGEKKAKLLVYKLNFQLAKVDSTTIDIGKDSPEDFLILTSDTLHNFLNIYLQKKEKKLVTVFRFNKNFKQIATLEDIEITRLNSFSAFENNIFYNKNEVFTIRSVNDTSGKQFYLSKYALKSELVNFEYEQKWQFAFERKNINSAKVIYANKRIVLLYVNVIDGQKRGQWLLKVHTVTGLLIRGTKINDRGDNSFYNYGGLLVDTATKNIVLQGQKYNAVDFDQKENKLNISGKPFVTIYLAQIDSGGEMISRNEFKIPVIEAKGVVNKIPVNYLLRTNSFLLDKEGKYVIETDIFKNSGQFCYNYCNTNIFKIANVEEKLTLEKNSVNTNPQIEKFYFGPDKLDMNGKLCIDSITEFEKLFFKTVTFKVRLGFKTDELNNPIWLLKKTETKKNSENYSTLSPIKKIYQLTNLVSTTKEENPFTIILSQKQFILSRQTSADKFQLQLYSW